MKNIGDEIARLRKAKKMSQVEIARRLEDYGIHIKNAAVSCWEQGVSIPTSAQLLALCEILEIRDIYKEFIGENPQDPFKDLNSVVRESRFARFRSLCCSSDIRLQSRPRHIHAGLSFRSAVFLQALRRSLFFA